jgi:hypothetical protein
MPVAFDSTQTFRYVISTDRDKPEAERPSLIFHYPTCRETVLIANKFDEVENSKSVEESIKIRCDAIRIILCGWENFRDRKGDLWPYNPSQLDSVLTIMDFEELELKLINASMFAEAEKKRRVLWPQSPTASSAPPASTDAKASPPPEHQPT